MQIVVARSMLSASVGVMLNHSVYTYRGGCYRLPAPSRELYATAIKCRYCGAVHGLCVIMQRFVIVDHARASFAAYINHIIAFIADKYMYNWIMECYSTITRRKKGKGRLS